MSGYLANTVHYTCALAVALIGASVSAQNTITAMLTVAGHVSVNGAEAPAATAVVPGDRILLASDGAATLSLPGSAITMSANSNVLFRGDSLVLQAGTVNVNTARGLRTQVDRYVVAPPETSAASFEVARANGSIIITALAGTLTITGAGTTTLEAGKSACAREGADTAPLVTQSARSSGSSKASSKAIAGTGLGGGAAAVASTVATRKKTQDASPAHP